MLCLSTGPSSLCECRGHGHAFSLSSTPAGTGSTTDSKLMLQPLISMQVTISHDHRYDRFDRLSLQQFNIHHILGAAPRNILILVRNFDAQAMQTCPLPRDPSNFGM